MNTLPNNPRRKGRPPLIAVGLPIVGFAACVLLCCFVFAFSQLPQLRVETVSGTVIDKFPVHYENGTLYHVLVAKNDGSREIFSISPSIYGLSSTALQEQVVIGKKYTFRAAGFNLADLIFRNIVSVTPSQ